ncbi:MAG TPA: beta-ketoacyl synthase chain length factor [Stellaceae bacterium]|nr:beta-ketoacyl synthase chain length factor [Stellaceae bacterium]
MRIFVEAVAVRGPGLNGWAASRPVLAGAEDYRAAPIEVPPSPLLPANERRRAVQTVKLALALGAEAFATAGREATETATVFTSSGGDGDTIHGILDVLASGNRELSPTRFHNSVHNAPAGYWSIATRSHAPSTSLCCYDGSFAAGLLEAAVQATVENHAVALIAYDLRYPEPLNAVRPIGGMFGTALVLVPAATTSTFAEIVVELRPSSGSASVMASAALEELRRDIPTARSLPLLAALARASAETLIIEYVSGLDLTVTVAPIAIREAPRASRQEETTVA